MAPKSYQPPVPPNPCTSFRETADEVTADADNYVTTTLQPSGGAHSDKHSEIGGALNLGKTSSVSSACLRMKRRIETEKRLARRARAIQQLLLRAKSGPDPFA